MKQLKHVREWAYIQVDPLANNIKFVATLSVRSSVKAYLAIPVRSIIWESFLYGVLESIRERTG